MTLQSRISDLVIAIRQKLNTMTPRLLPQGGTTGQRLVKSTSADYDTAWADVTQIFEKSSAISWTIVHNLGRYPVVTVVDSAGTQFFGTITYIDINSLRIDFAYATGGKAYLV